MSDFSAWAGSLGRRVALLARSAGVGAVATAADLGTLALLVHGLHWDARQASAPALALGVLVQFVGNKLFAFRDRDPRWARQALRFLAVEALGFVANLVLFDLAVRAVPTAPVALRLVTTNLVYFCVCLPLWTRIFRSPAEGGEAAAAPQEA
ncbi:MAG: GtrA family protein [Deltaproteobacteria bacterium]|nr:GtrA family protein [Deltaproteobacteria bacterium]